MKVDLAATGNISVGDADIDGVLLNLVPGSISGHVLLDRGNLAASALARMRLRLQPLTPSPAADIDTTGQYAISTDGTFTIPDVYPGEYFVGVDNLPQGSYLKSAQFGDTDVLHQPLIFSRASADPLLLRIVLGTNGGRIEGRATNAQMQPVRGAQVVLFPRIIPAARTSSSPPSRMPMAASTSRALPQETTD